ncbi:MAG: UDP-N-acetylglucosamine--N-acetylmuramyl-(pentapeptide) pyrophosphoryl-undecaprenol N-acetylglucosamine transferase, partial [Candidatus Omnitrophica bacterium]|nr:UDP-N-acetylglucosamine--N-acetylmuramyl-(pentapeptide) pyrophosphoryl-undecaprenol N-acetylglucosamine transferase [Candidatus Omnitrophota bacterium]
DTLLIIPGLSKLQVIHIFGDKDYEPLKNKYKDLPIRIKSFPFLAQMQYAYSAADLVISRAGAITIAELIYFKLPAIILPYPFAQAHQLSNAQVLEDAGSAVVIKDNELTPSKLGECLSSFINSPERLKKMQINYDNIAVNNAHSLLAEAAISLI